MTRTERTRERLVDAATSVLAARPAASLQDIADQAGIARATLHRHFGSREELLRAIALNAIRETDAAAASIPRDGASWSEALRLLLEAMVPLGDRYHFLSTEAALAQDARIRSELDRQLAEMHRMVDGMKAEGSLDRDLPSAWVVCVIDSLIYSMWSAVEQGHIARREAAALVHRTILRGLATRHTHGSTTQELAS